MKLKTQKIISGFLILVSGSFAQSADFPETTIKSEEFASPPLAISADEIKTLQPQDQLLQVKKRADAECIRRGWPESKPRSSPNENLKESDSDLIFTQITCWMPNSQNIDSNKLNQSRR